MTGFWYCDNVQKCICFRNPRVLWCLLRVLGDLGDKVGDLLLEVVPGVDVVVAETETSWQNHEADIFFARLPCLLVQADRQRVRHYSVILR